MRSRTSAAASRSISSAERLTVGRAFDAGFEDQEAQRDLALQRVGDADDGTFRNIGMGGQHLLDLAGRQAVSGDVDDVVGTGHHVDIPVGVDQPGVAGLIQAREGPQIRSDESLIGLPQGRQRPGRQRQLDRQRADLAGGELARRALGLGFEYTDIPARHGARARAVLDRQPLDAKAIGADLKSKCNPHPPSFFSA